MARAGSRPELDRQGREGEERVVSLEERIR
jgi:hypothetical protein